jgi:hypothetical protein
MNSGQGYLMKHLMQKQQDPLGLQGLPQVSPPRDGWPAIEASLRRDRRRRMVRRYAASALAAAAVAVLAVTVVVQQPPSGLPAAEPDALSQRDGPLAESGDPAVSAAVITASTATLDSLMTLSQQLESRLRRYRDGLGALPASDLVYQVELEDLVVQVDEELSAQPDSLPLWNQRVTLLRDLERLYRNSLRREYRQLASL